ncbi:MAG TPA: MerR family DNA-binding transcriptional regulator [Solirubrobacterales bacterium]|nr:MerR family DNA-binding transcriptional regulator [Solirubrobacterales bacterium]
MPAIRTNAAAAVLGVSPNTLRSWERRYGYPKPQRSPGNHRQYELVELQTLRDALAQSGNITTAIELARQRQEDPASTAALVGALTGFDEAAADRAMEESLAVRPVERSVEELLLPTLDALAAEEDGEAELEFACRWAMGWLHGARRLASAASRPAGVVLLDSSFGEPVEGVYAQALDLALRRAGFRVLTLSSELPEDRLQRAIEALEPTAIVLCGPGADAGAAGRLLTGIRRLGVDAPLYNFRGADLATSAIAIPSAGEQPSAVTGLLGADLRQRGRAIAPVPAPATVG